MKRKIILLSTVIVSLTIGNTTFASENLEPIKISFSLDDLQISNYEPNIEYVKDSYVIFKDKLYLVLKSHKSSETPIIEIDELDKSLYKQVDSIEHTDEYNTKEEIRQYQIKHREKLDDTITKIEGTSYYTADAVIENYNFKNNLNKEFDKEVIEVIEQNFLEKLLKNF